MEKGTYKVLIADDEYWTRKKLCNMLDWSRYSLLCMDPAVNGEDVLHKLEEEQPDILITDINMPFVNGVELLQIIQKKYPSIITFVISGYDDFQYVKESFLAGSINYLVKPITKIDLVNALSKALEIISSRQAEEKEKKEQNLQLLKASSLLQDREFSQLLEREESPFTPIITMNNDMDFAGMSLMLVKLHDMANLVKRYGQDMNLLSYSIKKEMREWLKCDSLFVFNHIYRSNEFAIISELDNKELMDKAGYLIAQLKPLLQSPITVLISGHSYSMDSIHEAYVQDIALLMTRKYTREDALLITGHKSDTKEEQKINSRFSDSQMKELKDLLKLRKRKSIEKLIFQKIGLAKCAEEQWDYLDVRQTMKRITSSFSEALSGSILPEEAAILENMINQSDRVVERLDAGLLCDVIEEIIDYSLSIGQDKGSFSISDIMRAAAAYIDENYYEELGLSSLARKFGVENSYFSRTFRQEIGENLMLYITRKRMEKAGEYMMDSDISLTEIAFMVGYDDYAYFNRVFRKTYGMSPREYRTSQRYAVEG